MTGLENRARRNGWPLDDALGSAVLGLLLASEVASLLVGSGAVYFASIVGAWFVLPAVVGPRNVLDAGCIYMLVSLGIVIVVDLASRGPIPLPT